MQSLIVKEFLSVSACNTVDTSMVNEVELKSIKFLGFTSHFLSNIVYDGKWIQRFFFFDKPSLRKNLVKGSLNIWSSLSGT